MTQQNPLNAPWSLHFDRDGTEDVAAILDADGEELVRSRHFWRPEGNDPTPPTLAAMRAMHAAPKLLLALQNILEEAEGISYHAPLWKDFWDEAKAAIAEATEDSIGRAA